jgi:hypothetical protein
VLKPGQTLLSDARVWVVGPWIRNLSASRSRSTCSAYLSDPAEGHRTSRYVRATSEPGGVCNRPMRRISRDDRNQ